MKYVYLDQNAWRILEDVEYGQASNPKKVKFHRTAEQLVNSGDAIFPYSFINLFELHGIPDQKNKEKAANVMLKFSKNIQINIFPVVWRLELESEILKRIGQIGDYDLTSKVFNKQGLMSFFGIPAQLKPIDNNTKIDEKKNREILDKLNDPKILLRAIANPSFSRVYEQTKKENEEILSELEKTREIDKKEDEHMRKKIRRVNFITQQILDPLLKFCIKQHIDPFETGLFPKQPTNDKKILKKYRQEHEKFLKNLPAHYTYHTLTISRDWDFSRDVDVNDNNDISALSMAIPYCDIVITEKYFKTLAIQGKLGQLYKTKILKLEEIDKLSITLDNHSTTEA